MPQNVALFRNMIFIGVIKLKWEHILACLVFLREEEIWRQIGADIQKQGYVMAQREDDHLQAQEEWTVWSRTSILQKWEQINFNCLIHLVCGRLLC